MPKAPKTGEPQGPMEGPMEGQPQGQPESGTRDAGTDSAAKPALSPIAAAILAGTDGQLLEHVQALEANGPNADASARVLEEVIAERPALGAPYIARLVKLLLGGSPRSVQTAATVLPCLVKAAPAKVARHLDTMREGFDAASEIARDGTVRTFIALSIASVAYQRRVIDVLEKALSRAEPAQLVAWTELALPALKGEPHAQARAVVEQRLLDIPKVDAQRIADFLGIRLRVMRP